MSLSLNSAPDCKQASKFLLPHVAEHWATFATVICITPCLTLPPDFSMFWVTSFLHKTAEVFLLYFPIQTQTSFSLCPCPSLHLNYTQRRVYLLVKFIAEFSAKAFFFTTINKPFFMNPSTDSTAVPSPCYFKCQMQKYAQTAINQSLFLQSCWYITSVLWRGNNCQAECALKESQWNGALSPALFILSPSDKPLMVQLVDWILRGTSQVMFVNNPLSGLIILVGLFIQKPWWMLTGCVGTATSTLTALALSQERYVGPHVQGDHYGIRSVMMGCSPFFNSIRDSRPTFPTWLGRS